jgi:hypothetical protein
MDLNCSVIGLPETKNQKFGAKFGCGQLDEEKLRMAQKITSKGDSNGKEKYKLVGRTRIRLHS